jgi:hypothetical protein
MRTAQEQIITEIQEMEDLIHRPIVNLELSPDQRTTKAVLVPIPEAGVVRQLHLPPVIAVQVAVAVLLPVLADVKAMNHIAGHRHPILLPAVVAVAHILQDLLVEVPVEDPPPPPLHPLVQVAVEVAEGDVNFLFHLSLNV